MASDPKAELIKVLLRLHETNLALGWFTPRATTPNAGILYDTRRGMKIAPIPVPREVWEELGTEGVLDALTPALSENDTVDYLNGHYRGHAITTIGTHLETGRASRLTIGTYHDGLSAALLTLFGEEADAHVATNFPDDEGFLDQYTRMPLYRSLRGACSRTLAAIDVYEMEHGR